MQGEEFSHSAVGVRRKCDDSVPRHAVEVDSMNIAPSRIRAVGGRHDRPMHMVVRRRFDRSHV